VSRRGQERRQHGGRYKALLRELQIDLVSFQRHLLAHGHKVLLIFEGRDAAGKDGVIKRFTEHLSPRDTRVVALGAPSDRERQSWYFQRYVPHLPVAGEMVLFNRSWYNRAGVEPVMGFCTDEQYEDFIDNVGTFEGLLLGSGIQIFKFYLDISREEQAKRLADRHTDPLKQWKTSPVDESAQALWGKYSTARDAMFARTHTRESPWIIVHADDKKRARLNVIRYFLARVDCPDKREHLAVPDPEIVFPYRREVVERLG
jgi:polyphosphate kinase